MEYKINNYHDYISFLKTYKHLLNTDQAIHDMLKDSRLKDRFGITIHDVKKDLRSLSEKEVQGAPIMSLQGGVAGKIKDSISYDFLIAEWAKNQHKLTVKKLEDLIFSNHLNGYLLRQN